MMIFERSSCKALIKDYCANCTFAGFHFIADETKHWIERLLWLVLVILSWYGSALLIIAAWDAFVTSPISFGVETTYLNWDTKMPAVAICEMSNDEKVYAVSDEIWPPGHLLDLEDALKDIAYFRGVSYSLVDVCFMTKNPDPLCPTTNFSYYVNLIRSNCEETIRNCSYNDQEFPCCEYFQPIDTDTGTCYIINSIQTKNLKPYPMVSNLKQKRGILKFEVLISSLMYTLGEDEVPSITSLQSSTLKIQLGHYHRRQVTVRNIENDPLIVDNTAEQRACRFHYENDNGVYPHYSYSACNVQCRKKEQVQKCGCNDHLMIGTTDSEHCNISGMACLHMHSMDLTTLKPHWGTRPGLACNCMPSCDETEITVIQDVDNTYGYNQRRGGGDGRRGRGRSMRPQQRGRGRGRGQWRGRYSHGYNSAQMRSWQLAEPTPVPDVEGPIPGSVLAVPSAPAEPWPPIAAFAPAQAPPTCPQQEVVPIPPAWPQLPKPPQEAQGLPEPMEVVAEPPPSMPLPKPRLIKKNN